MKPYLAVILLFLKVSSGLAQNPEFFNFRSSTSQQDVIYKNHIKTESIYECKNNKNKLDSILLTVIFYDTAGREILNWQYEDGIRLTWIDTLVYEKKNLVLNFSYTPRKKQWNRIEYQYDSAGNEIMITESHSFDTLHFSAARNVYNNKKQLTISYINTPRDTGLYILEKYYYNDQGNLIKTDSYTREMGLIYSKTFEYNNKSKLTGEYAENQDGRKKIYEYSYNEFDQCISKKFFGFLSDMINTDDDEDKFSYNVNGTLSQWIRFRNDKSIILKHHYSYYTEPQGNSEK